MRRRPLPLCAALIACLAACGPVRAAGQQQAPDAGRPEAAPISMDLAGADLADFFRLLSRLTGMHFVLDPEVKGSTTLRVQRLPWTQVLEAVLGSHGLEQVRAGQVVRIASSARLRAEAQEESRRQEQQAQPETATLLRRLSFARASEIAPLLHKHLSPQGRIDVQERANALILSEARARLAPLAALLAELDVPEPQVEIEARVVEATTSFSRDLGVQLGLQAGTSGRERLAARARTELEAPGALGILGLRVGASLDTLRLDAVLTAAERSGDARILSRPRIQARNNVEARIIQGSRIPVPVSENFTTTVRFEEAALKLTVTPRIQPGGGILLQLKVENNVPDFSVTVAGIPVLLISEAQTQVLLQDGDTAVAGGIRVESDRSQRHQVPLLGAVPGLGHLFRRNRSQKESREILFFLTTRLQP